MGQLNYSRAVPAAVATKPATDSSEAAASTAFVQALIPAGVVLPYAGPNAPTGWLFCEGQTLNRVDYPALFAAIGITYGEPDANTFKAPDTRGEFIRGLDRARGVDAGRALGSGQLDAFQGHFHNYESSNVTGADFSKVPSGGGLVGSTAGVKGAVTDGVNGAPRAAAETRPRNVAFNHIIKAV